MDQDIYDGISDLSDYNHLPSSILRDIVTQAEVNRAEGGTTLGITWPLFWGVMSRIHKNRKMTACGYLMPDPGS